MGQVEPSFTFSVATILPASSAVNRFSLFNPFVYFAVFIRLVRARPKILVVSLWRATIIGIMLKLFQPRTHLVLFLHYPLHVHALDAFFTRLAAPISTRIWADSYHTLISRLPRLISPRVRVISFVTEHISPTPSRPCVRPSFIFWGRIHPQKCISRALAIFASVYAKRPDARFLLIGPDGGDLLSVKRQVYDLGLCHCVSYRGALSFADIRNEARNADFYLQTSVMEGMAMSVVEAMQLGLVPVVTPVGEINYYARSGRNAVIVYHEQKAVEEIMEILGSYELYKHMRDNAIAEWQHQPLYRQDVARECNEILMEYPS
jgi:glycosyltransferase involved in cell wall biosynthesis